MAVFRPTIVVVLLAAVSLATGCTDDEPEGQSRTGSESDATVADDAAGSDGTADTAVEDGTVDMPVEDGTEDSGSENVAGRHDHVITVEELDREFIVYVPDLAEGAEPVPVVFMFHGTSGDGEKFYNISRWRELADAEGLIAVFPSALKYCFWDDENGDDDFDDPGELKTTTKWAAGKLGDELPLCTADEIAQLPANRRNRTEHPLVDDLLFVDAILETLQTDYSVDTDRIYASGFSNGGAMTSFLAAHRSDRFAAVAASGGFIDNDIDAPSDRPLSIVASLGENDDRFTGPLGVDRMPLDETLLDNLVARAIFFRYLPVLQLTDDYTYSSSVVEGRTVSRFTFATSTVGADNEFQIVIVQGLGHQYPNGDNHPIRIVDPLWAFFSRYSLD